MADHLITLEVDTVKITQPNPNLAETCFFSQIIDGVESCQGVPFDQYYTQVNAGDTITWTGIPWNNPSADTIHIFNVTAIKGTTNVLSNFVNSTPDIDATNTFSATVESTLISPSEDDESYTIEFWVNGEEKYKIDPIIAVKPPPPTKD